MSKLVGTHKFNTDIVEEKELQTAIYSGRIKYPGTYYQLRLYEKSHDYGYTTCIQLCWYSK